MKPEQTRLRQEEQLANARASFANQEQHGVEFQTVEDLLRHDRAQNPPPDVIADRLGQSVDAEPKARRSWFRRFLG